MNEMTALSVGLFAAWAAHDTEELITMSTTSRGAVARTPALALLPPEYRERGISQAHVNLAIGLMAVPVAGASVAGVRTQGRSRWFRGAVLAFGAHGVTHLAASVATRGYTSGVATAPVIVIPYWMLARRVLRRHGLHRIDATIAAAACSVIPLLLGVHLVTARILGERSLRRGDS